MVTGQPTDKESDLDNLKKQAWDRALHAFGTAQVFDDRARRLGKRITIIEFLGFFPTVVLGAVAATYGIGFRWLGLVVMITAPIAVGQAILSLWSLVARWVDNHSFARASVVENQRLARRFKELGEGQGNKLAALRNTFDILKALDDNRQDQDYTKDISDEEKRMGMRAALRERGKACAGCGNVPISMTPTNCDVCGNFRRRWL